MPIQSTYMMADESTRQREFGNLQAIRNNYPKYVVSLDEWTSGSSIDGVKHIHLGEFLQMSFGCFRKLFGYSAKSKLSFPAPISK